MIEPAFFTPAPGEPDDECPLCHIHRQHAGNPEACSAEHFEQPGCFAAEPRAIPANEWPT